MDDEIHRKLDSLRTEVSAIREDLGIIKAWKKTTSIYVYSLWLVIIGFISKKMGA